MEEYLKRYAELKKAAVDEAVGIFERLMDKYDLEFVDDVLGVLEELVDWHYEEEEYEEYDEEEDED